MERWKLLPVTSQSVKDLCLEVFDHQTAAVIFNAIERYERDEAIRAVAAIHRQKGLKGGKLHAATLKDLQKRENFFTVSLSPHIIKHALNAKNEE